jgi:ornithine cyclodeaminase
MRILNACDVRRALPMAAAIEAMKEAFAALAAGRAEAPLRAVLPIAPHRGTTLVMPAFLDGEGGQSLTVKVVSLFPGNRARGLPLIHAAVLVLEADTGRALALLEGGTLTAIRTGATSGAATDLLSRPGSRTAAIIGTGVQARTQLEAVATVRALERVFVFNPSPGKAEAFAAEVAGKGPIPLDVRAAASAGEALAEADIVCCATTSERPVFDDADLRPGTHLNAVGSFQPHVQEVPEATVRRALIVVDDRDASLAEAGDLIQPIERGVIGEDRIHADLGELVLGRASGRTSDEEVTFFKSVGLAVQDAAAARVALANATAAGLGERVDW